MFSKTVPFFLCLASSWWCTCWVSFPTSKTSRYSGFVISNNWLNGLLYTFLTFQILMIFLSTSFSTSYWIKISRKVLSLSSSFSPTCAPSNLILLLHFYFTDTSFLSFSFVLTAFHLQVFPDSDTSEMTSQLKKCSAALLHNDLQLPQKYSDPFIF